MGEILFHTLFLPHSSTTSLHTTALGNSVREIRLAAVV